jgi:hypothetical protein
VILDGFDDTLERGFAGPLKKEVRIAFHRQAQGDAALPGILTVLSQAKAGKVQ